MGVADDLFAVARRLSKYNNRLEDADFSDNLIKLEDAANSIGKSWSGSWIGYHARVYYREFQEPPADDHFSQEWGGTDPASWVECRYDDVIDSIKRLAGNPDITSQEKESQEVGQEF
ncbi:MAG: hypothetical protein GY845_36925 [Planctomycetes bacterium]|nr:hypothetical protein [Planctomycetota bacterium]